MAKDPAFLFYPGDWLGGTIGMTLEEKGAYLELLILQFNRGHMTSHMVGQVVGQLWVNVKDKFVQDENGLWYNERLDDEKNKRKSFTDSRKNNLKGKNQYSKNGYKGGHMTSHMENENENENRNEDENFGKSENLLIVPEMLRIFKSHNPNYLSSESKDFRPLFSIASYLCEVGKLSGSPDLHRDQVLEAWEPICKVIKADKFYSQKSLITISNHIQEILQISLHGKSTDNKPNYGSKERAKEYDRLFAERYGKG